MSCQHCHKPQCATTVVLIDGRQVCSWSDDWRHECEARHVANMPTTAMRRAYLFGIPNAFGKLQGGIESKRGVAALERMKTTVSQIWDKKA